MSEPQRSFRHALASMGPVGRDLLDVDWSATPLGPPEEWPQSLRTAAGMVLGSRFSMWMAWGPQLTFLCNDAYRRDTLGKKYPWALGKPAAEVWTEIWPDIGPRIEHVMSRGEATWDEALLLFLERSGYVEETYHTFSYSPLTGDDGDIAGMLCVVTEDTERIIANRRIATLRDLGSDLTSLHSEAEMLETASRHLAANPKSLPFSLVYLFEDESDTAHLATSVGFRPGHPAAPPIVLPGDDGVWPAAELTKGRPLLIGLRGPRFSQLPTGAWSEGPEYAYLVPLGQQGEARPWGFLVVGLNRHRPFDANYRSFLDLVGGQLSAGLASARAYETERRRAEQLAELDRAKTQFFTNISHELRTPLTLISGPADDALADTEQPLPDRQRERLELISRNTSRLLHLVNDLLDFSRIEAGRMPARFEEVDLTRHTAELASMFRAAVERAGLELVLDLEPVGERVYVDRDMWAKIVLNLLSNAVKHTFEGSISVRLRRSAELVELSISDTGIGIAESDQPLLFERFRRVDGARARTHEGSGIGLALVAELAALHGGDVAVESVLGAGSTFTVRLPVGSHHLPSDQVTLAPAPSNAPLTGGVEGFITEVMRWLDTTAPASTPDEALTAGTPGGGPAAPHPVMSARPRVLVADDNADMRAYIARLLEPDYDVVPAVDGEQALHLALANPPDLVLSDVMMPRLDGLGLLQELRRNPGTVSVPVVMLSARAGDEGIVEGLEAGADDYLVKPFSARELVARVRSAIELDRTRRTRDELSRHRALLDQAQRLAHVASWEIDVATGVVTGSDELLRILGIDRAELEHMRWQEAVEQFSSEGHQLVASDLARRVLTASGEGRGTIDEDLTVSTSTGDRTVHVLGEVVVENGRPVKVRGSMQDVTDLRASENVMTAAVAEREATAREHRIADELQRSLLPPRTFDPEHLGVATYYRAGVEGTQVGGDWYDVIDLGAGRTALVIGDVMGRGVRAAAVMGQLRSAIRAYARLDLPPADVLEMCDVLVRDLGGSQIVTCVYACYDPTDRSVVYARAGHVPPLLVVPGEAARPLTIGGGPPLGAGPVSLSNERIELPPGASIALYTDGLIERRNRDLNDGIDALGAQLTGTEGQPIEELPERLVTALLEDEPDDDIALLLARVPADKPSPVSITLDVPDGHHGVRLIRHEITGILEDWGLAANLVDDVALVVSELVTNAIVHGVPPARVRLSRTSGQLILEVCDAGALMPRRQRIGLDDEHGRGLHVVAVLADQWGARPVADGKCVWCAFELAGSAQHRHGAEPADERDSRQLVGDASS